MGLERFAGLRKMVILLAACAISGSVMGSSVAGPYKLLCHNIETCPPKEYPGAGDDFRMDGVMHYNHTLGCNVFDGTFTLKNDILTRGASTPDLSNRFGGVMLDRMQTLRVGSFAIAPTITPPNFIVTLDFAKWDSVSGWREHFVVMPIGDFCFLLEDVGSDVAAVVKKFVPGYPGKCPAPNMVYNCSHVPAKLGQLRHFPMLPYGRFRVYATAKYTKKPEIKQDRMCIKLIVNVVPKVAKGAKGMLNTYSSPSRDI